MKCLNDHTYLEMLNAEQQQVSKWSGTARVTWIQPRECPICGSAVVVEVSDMTPIAALSEKEQADE